MGSYPSKGKATGGRNSSGGSLAQSGYFFQCAICRRQPRTPRALPCLHTFCQECLAVLLARDPEAPARGGLICPQCGRLAVPRDPSLPLELWPSAYPLNVFQEALMPAVSASGRCLCRHREERRECRQCRAPFCARCGVPHKPLDRTARRKYSAIRLARLTSENGLGAAGETCLECGGTGFTPQERVCSHGECFDCVAERAASSSVAHCLPKIRFWPRNRSRRSSTEARPVPTRPSAESDERRGQKVGGSPSPRAATSREPRSLSPDELGPSPVPTRRGLKEVCAERQAWREGSSSQQSSQEEVENVIKILRSEERDARRDETVVEQLNGDSLVETFPGEQGDPQDVDKEKYAPREDSGDDGARFPCVEDDVIVQSEILHEDSDNLEENVPHDAEVTRSEFEDARHVGEEVEDLHADLDDDKASHVVPGAEGSFDQVSRVYGRGDTEKNGEAGSVAGPDSESYMFHDGEVATVFQEGHVGDVQDVCEERVEAFKAIPDQEEEPSEMEASFHRLDGGSQPGDDMITQPDGPGSAQRGFYQPSLERETRPLQLNCLQEFWLPVGRPTGPPSSWDMRAAAASRPSTAGRERRHSLLYERYRQEQMTARKTSARQFPLHGDRHRSLPGAFSVSPRRALAGGQQEVLSRHMSRCDGPLGGKGRDARFPTAEKAVQSLPDQNSLVGTAAHSTFDRRSRSWKVKPIDESEDERPPRLRHSGRHEREGLQAARPSQFSEAGAAKTFEGDEKSQAAPSTRDQRCPERLPPEGPVDGEVLPRINSSGKTLLKQTVSCGTGLDGGSSLDRSDSERAKLKSRLSLDEFAVSTSRDSVSSYTPKRTVSVSAKQNGSGSEKGQTVTDQSEAAEEDHCDGTTDRVFAERRSRSTSNPQPDCPKALSHDLEPALLTDVIVLPGNRVIATDWRNQCLKAWRWGDDSSSDVLPLEGGPHAMAKMASDTVAVSVPDAHRLVIVYVSPRSRLERVQTWSTSRSLYGLAALGQGKIAASCPWDKMIEIIAVETGQVEEVFRVPSPFPAQAWPEHLTVTSRGHIVISEAKTGTLLCLDAHGQTQWSVTEVRRPLGSCWDGNSTLYVADGLGRSVWRLHELGYGLEEVITPYNLPDLGRPRSVAWHEGMLFICEAGDIRVLCPK